MAKMESLLLWNSTSLEKEAPDLKSQKPVTDSFWDKEAGPPSPQSSLTNPVEEEFENSKWEASKDKEAIET